MGCNGMGWNEMEWMEWEGWNGRLYSEGKGNCAEQGEERGEAIGALGHLVY